MIKQIIPYFVTLRRVHLQQSTPQYQPVDVLIDDNDNAESIVQKIKIKVAQVRVLELNAFEITNINRL